MRIKETVSLVIKNCADCKEMTKVPSVRPDGAAVALAAAAACKRTLPNGTSGMGQGLAQGQGGVSAAGRLISIPSSVPSAHDSGDDANADDVTPSPPLQHRAHDHDQQHRHPHLHEQPLPSPAQHAHTHPHPDMHPLHHHHNNAIRAPVANMQLHHHHNPNHTLHSLPDYDDIPLDPQIMQDVRQHLTHYHDHSHTHNIDGHNHNHHDALDEDPYRIDDAHVAGDRLAASTGPAVLRDGEGGVEGEGEDMVDFDGPGVEIGDVDIDGEGVEDVDVEGEVRRQLIGSSSEDGVGVGGFGP